jgi:hypothetical protein
MAKGSGGAMEKEKMPAGCQRSDRETENLGKLGSAEVLKSNPPPMKPISNETNVFRGLTYFFKTQKERGAG